MNNNSRNLFYYIMMGFVGIVFLFAGFIFRNDSLIFNRMIRNGLTMLGVGIVFFLATFKVQSNEKKDKDSRKINKAMFDERNQFISSKSSSITLDVMMTFSLLAVLMFGSLGMDNYAYIIAGYAIIASILRVGFSIYLRQKF